MATKILKAGEKVKWDTPQGETQGSVVGKETGATKGKGVAGDAKYRVKSAKSGKEAVHKASALKKA